MIPIKRSVKQSKNRLSKVLVIRSVTNCTHLPECISEKKNPKTNSKNKKTLDVDKNKTKLS